MNCTTMGLKGGLVATTIGKTTANWFAELELELNKFKFKFLEVSF